MFDLINIKKEYKKIKTELEKKKKLIDELEKDENVKKYIEIKKDFDKLSDNFITISLEYQIKKMEQCNHIYVKRIIDNTFINDEANKYDHFYCLKCQLDTLLAFIPNQNESFYRRVLNIYTRTRYKSICLYDCECYPILAKNIFDKIIKNSPNISDEDLIKSFRETFHSIKHSKKKTY